MWVTNLLAVVLTNSTALYLTVALQRDSLGSPGNNLELPNAVVVTDRSALVGLANDELD